MVPLSGEFNRALCRTFYGQAKESKMSFESFVGMRFLKPKRRQLWISVIGVITVVGVAVGVAALIVVISVLTGFQDFMQTKHLEAFSHLLVTSYRPSILEYEELMDKISAYPGVEAVTPFVYGEVMLASESGVGGSILRGIDPATAGEVTSTARNLKLGKIDSVNRMHPAPNGDFEDEGGERPSYPGILLGQELAASLHVVMGSEVRVVSPMGEATPVGMAPKMRRFVVSGIFSVGLYEFDAKFAFISLVQAQSFFNMPDSVTGLEVRLADLWQAMETGTQITDDLGWPYRTISWMEMNRNLFSAMKLEKLVMFIIVSLIMFVAALNIFSTTYLLVMDKQKSIAILKTMGASSKTITRLFIGPGLLIGFIGSLLGLLLGGGICLLQMKYGLVKLDPSVYWFEELPMKFKALDFLAIAGAAFVFSFLATIIPARIASRFDPVNVLRYE